MSNNLSVYIVILTILISVTCCAIVKTTATTTTTTKPAETATKLKTHPFFVPDYVCVGGYPQVQ